MSEGSIILSVDDEIVGRLSGYRTFGWNNPSVFSGDTCQEHMVDIRMAKGDETKDFVLLALGYC